MGENSAYADTAPASMWRSGTRAKPRETGMATARACVLFREGRRGGMDCGRWGGRKRAPPIKLSSIARVTGDPRNPRVRGTRHLLICRVKIGGQNQDYYALLLASLGTYFLVCFRLRVYASSPTEGETTGTCVHANRENSSDWRHGGPFSCNSARCGNFFCFSGEQKLCTKLTGLRGRAAARGASASWDQSERMVCAGL